MLCRCDLFNRLHNTQYKEKYGQIIPKIAYGSPIYKSRRVRSEKSFT